jgi:hypothetical protein
MLPAQREHAPRSRTRGQRRLPARVVCGHHTADAGLQIAITPRSRSHVQLHTRATLDRVLFEVEDPCGAIENRCSALTGSHARSLSGARACARAWPMLWPARALRGHPWSTVRSILDVAWRRCASCAVAAIECPGDAGREPCGGAAGRRLDPAVDHLCAYLTASLQPRPHLASLIDASQRIVWARDSNAHLLHPLTEAAQRESHASEHHRAHSLRHAGVSAPYFDLQAATAGVTMPAPAS